MGMMAPGLRGNGTKDKLSCLVVACKVLLSELIMVEIPTTHRGAARARVSHVAEAPGLPESTPPTVAPAHLLLIPPSLTELTLAREG